MKSSRKKTWSAPMGLNLAIKKMLCHQHFEQFKVNVLPRFCLLMKSFRRKESDLCFFVVNIWRGIPFLGEQTWTLEFPFFVLRVYF